MTWPKPSMTPPSYLLGTPQYLAPEQLRGEQADPRTDLYAVGLVLFEMLHGRSLAHFIKPLARARALREPQFDTELPVLAGQPELQAVLDRALRVDPDQRFQTAREFQAALT